MNEPTPTAYQQVPEHRPRRWPMVLLGFFIFGCGVIAGVGGTVIVARATVLHAIRHPEDAPKRIARHLERNLDLSPQQKQQVHEIIARRVKALQQIREEANPRVREQLDSLRDEVAEVLDDRQEKHWRKRFNQLERLLPPVPKKDNRDS